MKLFRRLFHPLITFISIQIIWILVLFFWIYWFLGRHQQIRELAGRYQAEWLPETTDWLILAEGILLLVAILIGVYVIFIYWRRQASLNRTQQYFIHQITHELKSPLASIQLHLETIQLRQPTAEQLQHLVTMMQADSRRLEGLINNLLTAGRIEHKKTRLNLQRGNLSEMLSQYLDREQAGFPREGTLERRIEPGLIACFETETLETALRNLLENAILYSNAPPHVTISLQRDGAMAHLVVADHGRGIPPRQRRKVFRMFYRLRHDGKSIRGSGLGLYIVRNIIRLHGGKIWLESAGSRGGTAAHLMLPLTGEERTDD